MALNKKLTMAVSVIALAASGPLSAQPFPQPSAQEPSGTDPFAAEPWASQGLASDPGAWGADPMAQGAPQGADQGMDMGIDPNSADTMGGDTMRGDTMGGDTMGADMMGADMSPDTMGAEMGGQDTGMDPAAIPEQGGADFFEAQPAPQPLEEDMDGTQGISPDAATTPTDAGQLPWGDAAPQAEANTLDMGNAPMDAPQEAQGVPQDMTAPIQPADAPSAADEIFTDPVQDAGQDWPAQDGTDAGLDAGADAPLFAPGLEADQPAQDAIDANGAGLAQPTQETMDMAAPESPPLAEDLMAEDLMAEDVITEDLAEDAASAPMDALPADPEASEADALPQPDLPQPDLPQPDLPMQPAEDLGQDGMAAQDGMADMPVAEDAGALQDGQGGQAIGDQPQNPDAPQQDNPAPSGQDATPSAPDAEGEAATQSGVVIAPTQEAAQPQPATQAPADTPAAVSQEVQEAVQADPTVQQSVQVLENTADTPLAATEQEPENAPTVRTIEDSRSADEEFSGTLSASPTITTQDNRDSERRREREARRDRLEAAGLGAIAGLAVGAIINSRQGPDQSAVGTQEVVATAPERIVVLDRSTNIYQVWRDDDSILRQPGMREETTVYPDGSVRTVLYADNGTQVRTIRDARGRVLRRERIVGDQRIVILDDLQPVSNVDVRQLPAPRIPRLYVPQQVDPVLGAQIVRSSSTQVNRTFSLGQVRNIWEVRRLVPVLDTDPVLFATGSSALTGQQAAALSGLAAVMLELLRTNPGEIFLVEGHTDAVGSAASNLALSDRRAETVAQALVDYFGIPASNLVFQGYGESLLAVNTAAAEPRNRRVEIRRITPLLQKGTQ